MLLYDLSPAVVAFSTERHASDPSAPYDGFNITWYTDDAPSHVAACRTTLCRQLGIDDRHLVLPRQVHGTRIATVTDDLLRDGPSALDGVDALITRLSNTCIGISTADCVPILLYDMRTSAVAAVHAGWRGTVARIASLTVAAMNERFGTRPADLRAVIGPSIGPSAFEVGDEVCDAFSSARFPMSDIAFQAPPLHPQPSDVVPSVSPCSSSAVQACPADRHGASAPVLRWHIDLWKASAYDLVAAGVPAPSVYTSALCTYTHHARFFSARRLGIHSGRIFTGIMLKKSAG